MTMNIDTSLIAGAITSRTKAIMIMHYGGVSCDMEPLNEIKKTYDIPIIEDSAHSIGACKNGQPLGSYGDFSCISFDRLKNVSTGEGGVLLCKEDWAKKVEVPYENGTDRSAFRRGEVSSYGWISRGSNFCMSEYTAAVLLALLEDVKIITDRRRSNWDKLYSMLVNTGELGDMLPINDTSCQHNGHIFFVKLANKEQRDEVMQQLNECGVQCSFHYVPLHRSAQGIKVGAKLDVDIHTSKESDRLLRLPMHHALTDQQIESITTHLLAALPVTIK